MRRRNRSSSLLCACDGLSYCARSFCLSAAVVRARFSRSSSRLVGPCAGLPAKKSADAFRRPRRPRVAPMMCRHSLQQCVADRALRRACLLFALMCALARTCGLSTVSSLCRAWIAPRRCRGALSPTRWSLICVLPWPCVRARVFADEKIVSIRRRSRRKLKNCRQRYRPSRRTALWAVACARAFCLALWNSLRARVACDDF